VALATPAATVGETSPSATLQVVRSGVPNGIVTVQAQTVDGTAVANRDYVANSQTITFQAGEIAKPFVVALTSPTAYIRFHGRNAATWNRRGGSAAERFDYLYPPEELREWVEPLRELSSVAEQAFAFFNNNSSSPSPRGELDRISQAAENAYELRRILDDAGVPASGAADPVAR